MTAAGARMRGAAGGSPRFPAPPVKHTVLSSQAFTAATQLTKITLSGGSNTGAAATDSTSPIGGQASHVRFTNCQSFGSAWSWTPTAPLDLSSAFLRFTLRVTDPTKARNVNVIIATTQSAYAAGNYMTYQARSKGSNGSIANWFVSGMWIRDSVHPGTMTTTGTGANLASIGYVVFSFLEVSGQTCTFDLAKVEQIQNASAKAKCVIWHDDSNLAGMTGIKTRLDAHGFPGNEATEWAGIGVTLALASSDLAAMKTAGWQLGTHSISNAEHTSVTSQQFFNQAARMRPVAMQYLADAADFTYWGGLDPAVCLDHVKAIYRSGRFNTAALVYPDTLPPPEPALMKAILVTEGADTFTGTWQPYLNNAIAIKGIAQFVFHQGIAGGPPLSTEFDSMLTWLDANRASIDVVTISQALSVCT